MNERVGMEAASTTLVASCRAAGDEFDRFVIAWTSWDAELLLRVVNRRRRRAGLIPLALGFGIVEEELK